MSEIDLLRYINLVIANPILDFIMVSLTYAGLAMIPLAAVYQLVRGDHKLGKTVLFAILAGFALAMLFQFLALRPRPDAFRTVIPTPAFPSFPSGHAAIAFAAATALGLATRNRRAWIGGLILAAGISFSRVYLGVHYPTDMLGGVMLGAAAGAAVYGLNYKGKGIRGGLRWLLWVQIAAVLLVTMMAYLDILPEFLLYWRFADKVFHFLLVGMAAFWLSFWETGRDPTWRGRVFSIPMLVFLVLVIGEEALQGLSPYRSRDVYDLLADCAGVVFFYWLSRRLDAPAADRNQV